MVAKATQFAAPAARRIPGAQPAPAETICLPEEAAVEVRLNGASSGVLMATASHLDDLAVGFLLTEGALQNAAAVDGVNTSDVSNGFIVDVRAAQPITAQPVRHRERSTGARSSCGMCGVRTLDQAIMPTPAVESRPAPSAAVINTALEALADWQPLNREARAVHAAAWCSDEGNIMRAREDVGRHNALDKLLGASALAGDAVSDGFVLISSRCSYEMVQKAAMRGVTCIVAISAPTGLAVRLARESGMNLIAIARSDSDLLFHSATNDV